MSAGSIVQVTLWNSPYLGNVMLSELALARCVREQFGLGTHFVLAPGAEDKPWLERLEREGVTWSIFGLDRKAWRAHLEGVVEQYDGALIHTHFTEADLQAAAAASTAGIPCVWHVRTGFTGYPLKQRLKDLIKWRMIARRRVARVITVSSWLAELSARRGAPRARIETIPNAIAADRFAELPERAAARERLGLDPDALVVSCFGWWPEIKGVDLYLDALEQIARDHPSLNALLVGEQRMREFVASRWPVKPDWLRMYGFVEDSAWLFAATDVFVSASRAEGQSSAIGEALACEIPVVMSDIPGTSVWKEAPGLSTFRSEDSGSLAAALGQVLGQSPQERQAAGRRSREWLEQNFSLDLWCARMCATYRALL